MIDKYIHYNIIIRIYTVCTSASSNSPSTRHHIRPALLYLQYYRNIPSAAALSPQPSCDIRWVIIHLHDKWRGNKEDVIT